jgi:hypothetical protein
MFCPKQPVECSRDDRWLEMSGARCDVSERMKIRYWAADQEVRSRSKYLSPDSISKTRRWGSSESRAARTQPAVPTGDLCRLGNQGGRKQRQTRLLLR